MSTNLIPPKYTIRQQELNWKNIVHATHDQICSCDDAVEHFLQLVAADNQKETLSRKEIKQIKCRLTGEQTGDAERGDAVDDLDIGDLEQLFGGDDDTEKDPSG